LNSTLNSVEATPGSKVQSLSESSFDAWIKGYKPNENSNNRTISYYPKGALAAAMLDIEIISSTNGKFKLDDLLRLLYNDFYVTKKQGFTFNDFKVYSEKICNKNLDDFFNTVVLSSNEINYASYFNKAGIQVGIYPRGSEPWLGVNTKDQAGKLTVSSITDYSSGHKGGLNVNDEIIAINNQRITDVNSLNKQIAATAVGNTIEVLISRDNILQTLKITLDKTYLKDFQLIPDQEASESAKTVRNKWLN
jgi:predicted metalloprotease with PDZ domain